MATMNASLPEPMKAWVKCQAESGRSRNTSDYIRDLVGKDQDRQAALASLQAAITDGAESGPPQSFDAGAFKLRMREKHVSSAEPRAYRLGEPTEEAICLRARSLAKMLIPTDEIV